MITAEHSQKRERPKGLNVQHVQFMKMLADGCMMYFENVCKFKFSLTETNLYLLVYSVIVNLGGTTGSICFFENVISSKKSSKTNLELSVGTQRHTITPKISVYSATGCCAFKLVFES